MQYQSQVAIDHDGRRVDAKSILDVLTLGAQQGVELVIEAEGPDAEAAVEALTRLVENNFTPEVTQEQGN
ncbi:Phosphocarrier protein HPr [Pseudobythopirellula maris]|uniref:Phosphocarrier protein HPr n=2 Tax=Pseudobythopirellula maris TaxID=2527991 RepID=A0A5C5ZVS1_9BACT|nr:Phosphocarrier protein HPr [Pseudobythopirellula maris]